MGRQPQRGPALPATLAPDPLILLDLGADELLLALLAAMGPALKTALRDIAITLAEP